MNGAESLVHTLLKGGVNVCFTNPGTSEMHFVAALDKIEGMRCVLCLFEGVVSGAADGYARMTGKPAATLLHLGPGLGNALANLHNAKKARSPIVNVVGEHATYHIQYNTPLTSDIEGIARPVSHWVKSARTSTNVGACAAEAIAAAHTAPGQIATLILPADTAWGDGGVVGSVPRHPGTHAHRREGDRRSRRRPQERQADAAPAWRGCALRGAARQRRRDCRRNRLQRHGRGHEQAPAAGRGTAVRQPHSLSRAAGVGGPETLYAGLSWSARPRRPASSLTPACRACWRRKGANSR